MELSKQSYESVMSMPLRRFYAYLKWKVDLEEEKRKMVKEEEEKQKIKQKRSRK